MNNEFLKNALSVHGNQRLAHDLLEAIEIERSKPKLTKQISELQIAIMKEKGRSLRNPDSLGDDVASQD